MKLSFFGGARALTGHSYLLEVDGENILIDCGLQQSSDQYNGNALDFYASNIDHVLVTHAHLDSIGRLPLLVREGYYGHIIATPTTKRLMNIVLREEADHHTTEAWWQNKKGLRTGLSPIEPLFTMTDVVETMQQVETQEFDTFFQLSDGVKVRFLHSGHMIGSSTIEIWATEQGETRKIVFSGDVGCKQTPYASPPTYVDEADFVVLDSTCGNITHKNVATLQDVTHFANAIEETFTRSGNVLIPVNGVGRTQEVLHAFSIIKKQRLMKGFPAFKVYLDHFLAEELVQLFQPETNQHLGQLSLQDFQGEHNSLLFDDLVLVTTAEESKALNEDKTPKVILAGSGSGDRGRMKHHMKHNLWRRECSVFYLGSLASGSIGRRLQDGLTTVRLFGEDIVVKAQFLEFTANPSHADQPQLLEWLHHLKEKPTTTFLVHGTDSVINDFSSHLQSKGYQTHAPLMRECYNLRTGTVEIPGFHPDDQTLSRRDMAFSPSYLQLQDAVQELNTLLRTGNGQEIQDFTPIAEAVEEIIETIKQNNHLK